jgi:hypothetical protein
MRWGKWCLTLLVHLKLLVIIPLLLSVSCAGKPGRVTTTASAEIRKLDALAERNDYFALIQQLRSQQAVDNELLGWTAKTVVTDPEHMET